MGDAVNMVKDGATYAVPADQVAGAQAQGFTPESDEGAIQRVQADVNHEIYGGVGGAVAAGVTGLARGATLGLSDQLFAALGGQRDLQGLAEEHPYVSTASQIVGGLAPGLATGGAAEVGEGAGLLASTPAGVASRLGAKIAAYGEGSGALTKAAYAGLGGATEGAVVNAGNYLSQVALENKPLSAEGFIGAMSNGALWGGPTGSALSLSSSVLQRARYLFPKSEVTAAAAAKIDQQASQEIQSALDDGDTMAQAAQRKIRELRVQRAQMDLDAQKQVADIKVARAQAMLDQATARQASQAEIAKANEALAKSKLEAQQARTARAVNPPKRTRTTFGGEEPTEAGTPNTTEPVEGTTGSAPAVPSGSGNDDLLTQLQGTKAQIDAGIQLSDIQARAPTPGALPIEASDADVAAVSPEAAKLIDAANALKTSKERVNKWLASIRSKGANTASERGYVVSHGSELPGAGPARSRITSYIDETPQAAANRASFLRDDAVASMERLDAITSADGGAFETENPGLRAELAERIVRHGDAADAVHGEAVTGPRAAPGDIGEKIVSAGVSTTMPVPAEPSVEDQVTRAINKHVGEHVDLTTDIDAAAKAIGDYERASADMVDALGADAPSSAQQRAAQYRSANSRHADAMASNTAKVADDIDGSDMIPEPPEPPEPRLTPEQRQQIAEERKRRYAANEAFIKQKLAEQAADPNHIPDGALVRLPDGTEAIAHRQGATGRYSTVQRTPDGRERVDVDWPKSSLTLIDKAGGVPKALQSALPPSVPSSFLSLAETREMLGELGAADVISAVPVVGPVLGVFLKAKALGGIAARRGGSVGETAESVIAQKSAQTRNRVGVAIGRMLDAGSARARNSEIPASSTAAVLGSSLFPGGHTAAASATATDLYHARMDDLARAQQPGAVARAVADRIKTGDPQLLQAITDVKQRGLAFLDSKAPKQPVASPLIPSDGKWQPSKVELDRFARYVKAVDDPASVLEGLANGGHVTVEGAETLKTVYPSLYAEAQRILLQAAPNMQQTLPYARRVSLSILFGVPVDGTMMPSHLKFLSGGAQGGVSSSQAQAQGAPAQPPPPGLVAPVNVGTRTSTAMDRRAGA